MNSTDEPGEAGNETRQEKAKPYKFVVRLPMEMRDRIAEAAMQHRRSMNSEIVTRLEQTFSGIPSEAQQRLIEPPLHNTLDALMRRDLKEDERELLRTFRRLPADKRRALLRLLK